MRQIVLFLSCLDSKIQQRFNSICFFFMRRFGMSKAALRYAVDATAVIGLAAMVVNMVQRGELKNAGLLGGFMVLVLCGQHYVMSYEDAFDATAASFGRSKHAGKIKFFGIVYVISPYSTYSLPDALLAWIGSKTYAFAVVLLLYLAKTPKDPPAEKVEDRPTHLAESPVRT